MLAYVSALNEPCKFCNIVCAPFTHPSSGQLSGCPSKRGPEIELCTQGLAAFENCDLFMQEHFASHILRENSCTAFVFGETLFFF